MTRSALILAATLVAALGVTGTALALEACAPGAGEDEACVTVAPQTPRLQYEVASGVDQCSTFVNVHLGPYGTSDCLTTSTTLAFPTVFVPGLDEILGGAIEVQAGEALCPSHIAVALRFGATYFSACLEYDMGSGGEQLGFDYKDCGGTDPRVDVLGLWFAFCLIIDPTIGPPPGGDPGEIVVDPGLTFPVIDVTPCGGVDPSVTWMGSEALVCVEPSVQAPAPSVTVVECGPGGTGVGLVVAGQTVGACYYP